MFLFGKINLSSNITLFEAIQVDLNNQIKLPIWFDRQPY